MTVVPFKRRRTLAHILIDIAQAKARWENHFGDDRESELLDHLTALQDEARELVEVLTGVGWDQLREAL